VSELIETRWRRFGKDRVYVRTPEGRDVGHVDLVERTIVVKMPGYVPQLKSCRARWSTLLPPAGDSGGTDRPGVAAASIERSAPTSGCAPVLGSAVIEPPGCSEPDDGEDLVANVAGAAARAKRNEVNAQAPVMNMIARVLGKHTEERAWRVGAKGEQKVGRELSKLGASWHVIHAVPVGDNGSDIDHVVVGPPGVFTLNTKRHPGGKVWVAENAFLVNGYRTDYLRNSRYEAKRATRLLSAACPQAITVTPVIVCVDLEAFTLKQMPSDVYVTTRHRLVAWLRSLPPTLEPGAIDAIFAEARLSTTWR
jgi:hypothetical protein